jgi:biopolymer transport protein ExbD
MRIRHNQDDEIPNPINLTPLIDSFFILIIFLMVTMSFNEIERDLAVTLPSTDASLSSTVQPVIINVRKDGSYVLADKPMNLQNIQLELSKMLKDNPNQKVLIRGDQMALHGQVAAAIAACKKSGMRDANIAYLTNTTN